MNDSFIYLLIVLACLFSAYRAIVANRILTSTIWLAGISALVALAMYLLGAAQVAVIELSVGAGLVTVLLVYAISVVGDDAYDRPSLIPRPLAIGLVAIAAGFLLWLALPLLPGRLPQNEASLSSYMWNRRGLDVWVQIVLIFSGVMGMLGLLAEGKSKPRSGLDTLTEVMGQVPHAPEGMKATDVLLPHEPALTAGELPAVPEPQPEPAVVQTEPANKIEPQTMEAGEKPSEEVQA